MLPATRWLGATLVASVSLGCAGAAPAPADSPTSPPAAEPPAEGEEPAVEPQLPRPDVLYRRAEAIPPPPAECPEAESLPAPTRCEAPFERLAAALESGDDGQLTALETCQAFRAGAIRLLRAESSPRCADRLVEPVVSDGAPSGKLAADIRQELVALGLGARLRRTAQEPPPAPESRTKQDLNRYFREELFPWISSQAEVIHALAAQGSRLGGYARGVVAVEAGMADMRFVEIARAVPIPDEIAQEPEARDIYYASLDEALDARKRRGRDAALVGLADLAEAGIHDSQRLDKARELISQVFAGHRIDSLDALMLPPFAELKPTEPKELIVARVPASHATKLIGDTDPRELALSSYLQRGLPLALRQSLRQDPPALPDRLLVARALLRSGVLYFRRQDFQDAATWLTELIDAPAASSGADAGPRLTKRQLDEARFVRAVAVALSAGPKNAAALIAQGPRFADSLGNLALLDAIASGDSSYAGLAGFNAAYLRELVAPPQNADYWRDLERRYATAARKLDGARREQARQRAKDARDTARSIESS